MIDKDAIHDDLTEAFIDFMWRQENPMQLPTETRTAKIVKYQSDHIFNSKVKSMVCGVMSIVDKHA